MMMAENNENSTVSPRQVETNWVMLFSYTATPWTQPDSEMTFKRIFVAKLSGFFSIDTFSSSDQKTDTVTKMVANNVFKLS
jgi:hypothetical protein